MKTMSDYDPKQLPYAFFGLSNRKGIFMRLETSEESEDKDTHTFSAVRFPGTYACIGEDGSIKTTPDETEKIWDEVQEKEEADGIISGKMRVVFHIIAIACFAGMFGTIFVNDYLPSLCLSFFWIFYGLSYITPILLANWRILRGDEETKQMFRFHAAEHAAINAYYELKRVPTLEEIKKYSNFSYRCGITRAIRPAWVDIGIGICRLAPGLWFIPLAIIFLLFSFWAAKKRFYFTEVVFLANPTDFEYEVAIQAMTGAVKAKEELKDVYAVMFEQMKNMGVILSVYETADEERRPMFRFQIGNPDDLEDE